MTGDIEEKLAKLANRKQKREEVNPHTKADIVKLISEFDPNTQAQSKPTTITGKVNVENHVKEVTATVAPTSKRQMIIEGLNVFKKQSIEVTPIPTEINGQKVTPLSPIAGERYCYVDRIIKVWLGGTRRGTMICWDLDDGYTYKYDMVYKYN